MRNLSALVVALSAVAGCLEGQSAEAGEGGLSSGLFTAGPEGLLPVDRIGGLSSADGLKWTWHPLDTMAKDTTRLLLFQPVEDAELRHDIAGHIVGRTPSPLSEEPRVRGVCNLNLHWSPAPGGFFIDRAMGEDPPYPDDPFVGGYSGGSSNGDGGGSFTSTGQGSLAAGAWMLFVAGLGGLDPAVAMSEGSEWSIEVESSAPVKVVEVSAAPYHCGAGFSTLPGASSAPFSPVEHTTGGELAIEGAYGTMFSFCPGFDLTAGAAPATALSNEAQVDFRGVVTPLTPAAPVQLEHSDRGSVTLTNVVWTGSPMWSMSGLWLPEAARGFSFC